MATCDGDNDDDAFDTGPLLAGKHIVFEGGGGKRKPTIIVYRDVVCSTTTDYFFSVAQQRRIETTKRFNFANQTHDR
jgi:hypothetical protein